MITWLLIDDSVEEANAFAENLSLDDQIHIEPSTAGQAEDALAKGVLRADGVLMDVDLSNETGMRNTGPGLAQNIRVAQQREAIESFPIVRFSYRARVLENIGHDTSSDDLFDLKIEKDGISDVGIRDVVRQKLIGVTEVYRAMPVQGQLTNLLGITDEAWLTWGHSSFASDFKSADRQYLAAALIIRLLVQTGLLIDEDVLAIRLGLTKRDSREWTQLLAEFDEFRYLGVASDKFKRWWARGLESWWTSFADDTAPLAGSSILERHSYLSRQFPNLEPLVMPAISLGDRPWRFCFLTYEETGDIIPVDPSRAVRLAPREALPNWLDPCYAALGAALRARDDTRLDEGDLERLQQLAKSVAS